MSTRQELLKTATILGVKGGNKMTADELRVEIRTILGEPDLGADDQSQKDERTDSYAATIAKSGAGAVAVKTGAIETEAHNIPNLSPTGQWQGKRARIKRHKTGHNDMSGAIFNWNGWPCIIPIDVEVDIAWPILEIIKNCIGMEMEIRQEEDPRNKARVNNVKEITYYDKYPFSFLKITPGTEHLPESPWEYTLDAYVDDFEGYTVRKWRQLCILWELSDQQCNIKAGLGPEVESDSRRNAIHYALNLPQGVDQDRRLLVRDQMRVDIGMEAKAA